jgi:hypothetical protein
LEDFLLDTGIIGVEDGLRFRHFEEVRLVTDQPGASGLS